MSHELEPIVGRWYRNVDREQLFKVVRIDEDNELIEILHFDGDREEIDTGAWVEMDLENAEAPEDWIDPDDSEDEDDDYEAEEDVEEDADWRHSRRRHRPPREDWEEDEEDWEEDDGDDD